MIQSIETNMSDVEVNTVVNGKITELKIYGDLFVVRPNTSVDPIKAAKDFISAFDIKKTAMIRKVKQPEPQTAVAESLKKTTKHRTRHIETDDIVAKINNIPITKEKIVGFYRRFPNTFTGKDMIGYFSTFYQGLSDISIANKQRAYIKFLSSKGYIKQIEGKGNYGRVYKFKEAPYGATAPAQAEYDAKYLIEMRKTEMEAARDK